MKYSIIPISKLNSESLSEVSHHDFYSVRKSIDNSKFIIKYIKKPSCAVGCVEYTKSQIIEIVSGSDWTLETDEI